MKHFICCLLLCLVNNFIVVNATTVKHPNIDLDSLQRLVVSGSYDGISLYKDTNQLRTIPSSTSSLITLSNDTLKLIASSNINGLIYDACILSGNTLFLGGNFSAINNNQINNIFALDLVKNQVKSLSKGLDGTVYSVYCDSDNKQVYVGGSFIAPVQNSSTTYSDSLAKFGGSLALWSNNQWNGLPWKGLDGPVYSILKKDADTLYFGGKFDTTTDGQTSHAPASQIISLSASDASATNSASSPGTPGSIVCASSSNPDPWVLLDGMTGSWTVLFEPFNVNPSLVRVANSKLQDYQAKSISIRSASDESLYQVSYLDPDTGHTTTCTTDCILSQNTSVSYQDFIILNTSLTSGIIIDINSWYGKGGALASVQVYQSEIFVYATPIGPSSPCMTSSNSNSTLPRVETTGGSWINTTVDDLPVLTTTITAADLTNPPSVTFYPNLVESGIYEVAIYTPSCSGTGCSQRTYVDVVISLSPTETSNYQMSQADPGSSSGQTLFTGYFDLSNNFQPSVSLALASNTTIPSGQSTILIAYAVQFIKDASADNLSSLLSYNTSQTDITVASLPWISPADNVPYGSVIRTMDVHNGDIYIGGTFTGTTKSNVTYKNIVKFDSSTNQMTSLTSGGLNGPIQSLVCTTTDLYAGGSFTGVSTNENQVKYLTNVARFDLTKSTWNPLDGGVNGAVQTISWFENDQNLLISGTFTQLTKSAADLYSNTTSGVAWWDTALNKWKSSSALPYFSGVVSGAFSYSGVYYYFGNIKSAQRYQANGVSFITGNDTLTPFTSFYPDGNQNNITVNAGVLYSNSTANTSVLVLGGEFNLPGNIQNIAIYENGTWGGVEGSDWQGQINSMAVSDDSLFVGGKFSGANITNFAVFSISNKTLTLGSKVKTSDGSPAIVNTIRSIPSRSLMVAGGNFDAVDSTACSAVCSLSTVNYQWTELGSNLTGEVYDIELVNGTLITSGNLILNNSPILIAQYNFDTNTWGSFSTSKLPGPSRAISYDNATNHVYISGLVNNTNYFRIWDGQTFTSPKVDLGPGSVISKMSVLPLVDSNNNSSQNGNTVSKRDTTAATNTTSNVLLVTGMINLGDLGNVSAAFYDGKSWIPYLLTSTVSGGSSGSSLSSLFSLDQPYIAPITAALIKHSLTTSAIIIISICISLVIVFCITAFGLLYIFLKRRRDSKVKPQHDPATYYVKPARQPQSILAALKNPLSEKTANSGAYNEKPSDLGSETQQIYNMSKSVNTGHLHEQPLTSYNNLANGTAMTTARAAPAPPNIQPRPAFQHYKDSNSENVGPSYNNVSGGNYGANTDFESNMYNNNNAPYSGTADVGSSSTGNFKTNVGAAALGAIGGAALASSNQNKSNNRQPELSATSYEERQGDNHTESLYENKYTTSNKEVNAPFTYKSPNTNNPFTNPKTNPSLSKDFEAAAMMNATLPDDKLYSASQSNDPFKYNNNAASDHNRVLSLADSEAERWSKLSEAASYAITKPVSLLSESKNSSAFDSYYGSKRIDSNQKYLDPSSAIVAEKLRWTNVPSSEDALSSSFIIEDPNFRDSEIEGSQHNMSRQKENQSNLHSFDSRQHPISNLTLSNSFLDQDPEQMARDSLLSDPRIARYTTVPSPVENIGMIHIEPNEEDSRDLRSPSLNSIQNSDNGSTVTEGSLSQAFVSTAPQSHDLHGDISPTAYHYNDHTSYSTQPDITVDDSHARTVDDTNDSLTGYPRDKKNNAFDRVVNTNAFRLSSTSSLVPADTDVLPTSSNGFAYSDAEEFNSAVRWRNTNIGSPIETASAHNFMEPASASVTRRSTNPYNNNYQYAVSDIEEIAEEHEESNGNEHTPTTDLYSLGGHHDNDALYENPFASNTHTNSLSEFPEYHDEGPSADTVSVVSDYGEINNVYGALPHEHNQDTVFSSSISPYEQDATHSSTNPYNYEFTSGNSASNNFANYDINSASFEDDNYYKDNSFNAIGSTDANSPITATVPNVSVISKGTEDGRAASKRMVEEYMSSRDNKTPVVEKEKSEQQSNFESIMAKALQNNKEHETPTEDHPHLYYAKYKFEAQESEELRLKPNDPIIVTDKNDNIWWMGYKFDGQSIVEGVFPSNYVEKAEEIIHPGN